MFTKPAGRIKPLVARLCLGVGSGLAAYVVCDVLLGYLLIYPRSPAMVPDPVVHHRLLPDTSSRVITEEFDYIQRVNNVGLRGDDVNREKPPGSYRILMLGDSFTIGQGVRDNETFSFLLEDLLNREPVIGQPVEVLNAGVSSYAPALSYLQLKNNLGHLEPDLVVLNLDMSDLLQEKAYRRAATYGPEGEILGIPGQDGESEPSACRTSGSRALELRRWIERNLYLTRALLRLFEEPTDTSEDTITDTVRRFNRKVLVHTLRWDRTDRKKQWNNLLDSVLKIEEYCDRNNLGFLLTVYPWGHQVNDREWVPGRDRFLPQGAPTSDRSIILLEQFAAENAIDLLNVFPAFRAYRGEKLLYYSHDPHWTAQGHQLMARELKDHLLARLTATGDRRRPEAK